jgi:hypothetical protein
MISPGPGPGSLTQAGQRPQERGAGVAQGERLRPTPLEVKEGYVTSVAFGPEGKTGMLQSCG